jgi:hypothetical protein
VLLAMLEEEKLEKHRENPSFKCARAPLGFVMGERLVLNLYDARENLACSQ